MITGIRELYCFMFSRGKFITSIMADVEPEFDVKKDLPEFLSLVLDRIEQCIHDNETDINDLQAQSLVLDRTVSQFEFYCVN